MKCRYYAVIEREDGSDYVQGYNEFEQLQELCRSLGRDYLIVDIFGGIEE